MVWVLVLVSLIAFVSGFASHSPGWMGFGICVGLAAAIAAALLLIERHVRASGRPEHMTEREVEALRGTLKKPGEPPRQLPPVRDE